jgi:phospholipid transport system substrate-binding protein
MNSRFLRTALGVCTLLLLFALSLTWSGMVGAKQHPREIVEGLIAEATQLLEEHGEQIEGDPVKAYRLFEPLITPHIDFAAIGERMLGPHWRNADERTRERFITEFKRSLVRTYASSMEEYEGLDVRVLGTRQRGDEMQVGIEVEGGSRAIFHFADGPSGWQLEDVTFEGVSIVQNFREDFRSRLEDKELPAVIQEMAARNREIGF